MESRWREQAKFEGPYYADCVTLAFWPNLAQTRCFFNLELTDTTVCLSHTLSLHHGCNIELTSEHIFEEPRRLLTSKMYERIYCLLHHFSYSNTKLLLLTVWI
jgi:hypothetical protein